jgi:hypothetical protein
VSKIAREEECKRRKLQKKTNAREEECKRGGAESGGWRSVIETVVITAVYQ